MEIQTLLIFPNVFATEVGFLEECDTIGIFLYYIVFDGENMKLCGEKGMGYMTSQSNPVRDYDHTFRTIMSSDLSSNKLRAKCGSRSARLSSHFGHTLSAYSSSSSWITTILPPTSSLTLSGLHGYRVLAFSCRPAGVPLCLSSHPPTVCPPLLFIWLSFNANILSYR